MEIDILIAKLNDLKNQGVARVFVHDNTSDRTLDLIEIQVDPQSDGQLIAD